MIDDLLRQFVPMIKDNSAEFMLSEDKEFPVGFTDREKAKSEYIRTQAYYHDKIINESYYNPDQDHVIQENLNVIQELIEQQEYVTAQYYLVSLQLLMGMGVKLKKVVVGMILNNTQITRFIDKYKYLGIDGPNIDNNNRNGWRK